MKWKVVYGRKAAKTIVSKKTPSIIKAAMQALYLELEELGPGRINWPNYKKLSGNKKGIDKRHCHLKKGKPTWVCCWKVEKEQIIIEVYYVGTHEKAPY
jgi:hypothetical protein